MIIKRLRESFEKNILGKDLYSHVLKNYAIQLEKEKKNTDFFWTKKFFLGSKSNSNIAWKRRTKQPITGKELKETHTNKIPNFKHYLSLYQSAEQMFIKILIPPKNI